MVVFRVGELGGQCGNWSDDVGSCGDHPHQQLQWCDDGGPQHQWPPHGAVNALSVIGHLLGWIIWESIWRNTVEISQTNATMVVRSPKCASCVVFIYLDWRLQDSFENNPCRKDVTSVKRHIPEESLTNVTSVTVTQLGTTACGVYTARESLGVPSFS